MSAQSQFRQYLDEQRTLPPDCLLGELAWFSVIEDAPYDDAAMRAEFQRLGLNEDLLPAPLRPDDAFEKASKKVDKFKYDIVGGSVAEVMVREVTRDSRLIMRHLIREVKDAAGKRLLYEKVGELVFYKAQARAGVIDPASSRCRATLDATLSPSERGVLQTLVDQFEHHYIRFRDFHDGNKVRGILRNYLLHLNGVQLRPGLYFVTASRSDELKRLQEFANGLKTAGMVTLPQPDLGELREEVIEVFQKEAERDLASIVDEIAAMREKKFTPAQYSRLKEDYDRVVEKATEYSRTLQVSQERTAGAAEAALLQLMALQSDLVKNMETR